MEKNILIYFSTSIIFIYNKKYGFKTIKPDNFINKFEIFNFALYIIYNCGIQGRLNELFKGRESPKKFADRHKNLLPRKIMKNSKKSSTFSVIYRPT